MYYLDGLGQSEIANIYGISRSTVSRLLTSAREQGIVRISVDESDPRDRDLEARLVERIGLRKAIVIRAPASSQEHVRRSVGYFAAPFVGSWLSGQSLVGLAGGRTLAELVHHVQPQQHGEGPVFIQLLGAIGSSPRQIDASEQCRTLARRLHGSFRTISLPAFAQDKYVRELFLSHKDIDSVWKSLDEITLALVGLGTLEKSAFIERGTLEPSALSELRAAKAVGEICGRFFDERGEECNTSLRERVVGVNLDVLRACKDVAVVMTGPSRGKALAAAVRGGIVKSLVVDQVGAQSILEDA
jgi:DNA-binding transcriptional regulator LsrR (DeoR family)